ncbi:hypothetical protein C6341_g14707 [Phytophthora cactorum]|nr:hypothetical protein C6341_g14707 [Phytophthora cactorum]
MEHYLLQWHATSNDVVAAALAAISDGSAAAVSGVTATATTKSNLREHDSDEKPRKLSDDTAADLEERGRRGGGGGRGGGGRGTRKFDRSQIHGPYTAIGLMYPNDTPYLKEDLRKMYEKWLKKKQAKNTRRLRA